MGPAGASGSAGPGDRGRAAGGELTGIGDWGAREQRLARGESWGPRGRWPPGPKMVPGIRCSPGSGWVPGASGRGGCRERQVGLRRGEGSG